MPIILSKIIIIICTKALLENLQVSIYPHIKDGVLAKNRQSYDASLPVWSDDIRSGKRHQVKSIELG